MCHSKRGVVSHTPFSFPERQTENRSSHRHGLLENSAPDRQTVKPGPTLKVGKEIAPSRAGNRRVLIPVLTVIGEIFLVSRTEDIPFGNRFRFGGQTRVGIRPGKARFSGNHPERFAHLHQQLCLLPVPQHQAHEDS